MTYGPDAVHPDFGPSLEGGWPQPGQSRDNAIEAALLDHLLGAASTRLTDRGGGRHSAPWEPKQSVRVGVLRPIIQMPQDGEDEDLDGSSDEKSQRLAAEHEPVAIGLDFVIELNDPDAAVTCEIDAEFALYQPQLPTLQEIRERVREQAERDGGSEGGRGGPARIPVPTAWQRSDVSLVGLRGDVPTDGTHVSPDEARIDGEMAAVIAAHFATAEAAHPFDGARTVAVTDLNDQKTWENAVRDRTDRNWQPELPRPRIDAFGEKLPDGHVLVSVSLTNTTITTPAAFQDLAMYDCRIRVRVIGGARIVPQRFNLAPNDYRYHDEAEVVGHGRNCVALRAEDGIGSETLPRHVQRIVEPRDDHVPSLSWSKLADNPHPILAQVEDAMRVYLSEWDTFLDQERQHRPDVHAASKEERDAYAAEIDRFALGRSLLRTDQELERAFKLANRTFAEVNAGRTYSTWRLFQLVYIVDHLAALAARRHRTDPRLRAELDHADVLWFPTGGGKTEAYLGLIVVAAFYDRLRGKDRGVTAWLRFPLRMLSVQQLARILAALAVADEIREKELGGGGDPFELGYLVGSGNTPNSLMYESKWWPGMRNAGNLTAEDRKQRRLIASCPYCGSKDGVVLAPDQAAVRLRHTCEACGRDLPIHMTDEEVYRYQPTVIVSTIDKITGYAHFADFTSFSWGPSQQCPDHGYHSFGCATRDLCDRRPRDMQPAGTWHDPVPSLVIQDELHLVREELGTFDAHFEGLIHELQIGGPSGLPSKMLAATATIEQYEDQLRQVYGRMPRRFPSPGFQRTRSFYTIEKPDIRRIFLGVMPTGGGTSKVEVSGLVQVELARAVTYLQDHLGNAREVIEHAFGQRLGDDELRKLLFKYEPSLAYVNNRGHGSSIADDLRTVSRELEDSTGDRLQFAVLTGDVPIAELASAIDRIEHAKLSQPRDERLRALVGTSVVSHGVDISRLNLMVMTGMPATVADYIQATSRSGRSHAGAVITVLDHFSRRESSSFTNFASNHRFLDRMVEPVPVNKYARNAVNRTLPAIVMALLWDLARNPNHAGPPEGIHLTRNFRRWWDTHGATLEPLLQERIQRVYRSAVAGVADKGLEDQLVARAVERWVHTEARQIATYDKDKTKELFLERVMSSLRDVDESVEFGGMPQSQRIYDALA